MADDSDDAPPKGWYEKPAEENVPESFKKILSGLRKANGIDNKLVVVPTAQHEAYTNMEYISLSGDYLAHSISENYHGYTEKRVSEDLLFVIQHEIGHLNIHPHVSHGWKEEIKGLPLERSRRGRWANVFSDVIVNYTAGNGVQLLESSSKEQDKENMNSAMWSAYAGGFRTCYDGNGSFEGQNAHRSLLERGELVDNRFNEGRYTNPATEDGFTPSDETPIFERWQGHGRGPQYYPSAAWAVAHKMPVGTDMGAGMGLSTKSQDFPDNWKKVQVKATVSIEYSDAADKWLGYNPTPGTCPLTGGSTTSEGIIDAGTYTVLKSRTYDGIIDTKELRPIEFWQIDYNGTPRWIPAHYCQSLCPHCGAPSPSQFELGFGYKPYMKDIMEYDPRTMNQAERSKLYAQLLNNLIAGLYATSPKGYRGETGVAAGEAWLHDTAWDMHLQHTGN